MVGQPTGLLCQGRTWIGVRRCPKKKRGAGGTSLLHSYRHGRDCCGGGCDCGCCAYSLHLHRPLRADYAPNDLQAMLPLPLMHPDDEGQASLLFSETRSSWPTTAGMPGMVQYQRRPLFLVVTIYGAVGRPEKGEWLCCYNNFCGAMLVGDFVGYGPAAVAAAETDY